jgi:large repetitive protein
MSPCPPCAETIPGRTRVPREAGLRVVVAVTAVVVAMGVAFPAAAVQARVNRQADPHGRVVDVKFGTPVALIAPWDRFRFSIDIVQPLTRESGAFLGDLDGDGVRDLFLASFNGSLMFVPGIAGQERLFGAGTLLRRTTSRADENPFAFEWGGMYVAGDVGDLDGDGASEVVVGRDIYRNVAAPPRVVLERVYELPRCCGPYDPSISFGDLDGDGDLDGVVTHNYASGGAYLYWNDSAPTSFTFTCQLIASAPNGWQPDNRLALGDLNGDGLLDLAGADGIYFNSGTADVPVWDVFTPSPWNVTGGPGWGASDDFGTDLFLVDIDADGDLDLYASGTSGTVWQALYYRNEGGATDHHMVYVGPVVARGTPVSTVHRGSPYPTFTVGGTRATAADIDGDGRLDVTVGGALDPAGAAILWNRAVSTPFLTYPDLHTWPALPHVDYYCGGDPNGPPEALCRPPSEIVAWRDIDGDGTADALLKINAWVQHGLYYYPSTGGWPFSLIYPGWPWGWPWYDPHPLKTAGLGNLITAVGVTFVDVDLDGKEDLIAGQQDGTLLWYRNTAATGMMLSEPVALTDALSVPIDVGEWASPTAIDLDGDGDLDLLAGVDRVLCTTPGQANGYTLDGILATTDQTPQAAFGSLFATDFDGDGLVDLLASGGSTNSVWLLRNTGTAKVPAFAVEPLLASQTSAAYLEILGATSIRLYFAVPPVIGETSLTYYRVPAGGGAISGSTPLRAQEPRRRLRPGSVLGLP